MAVYRVGMEIGGNRATMALLDGQGTVLCRRVFSGNRTAGVEQSADTLCDHLEDLLLKRGLQPGDVERIGIGIAGSVDYMRGVLTRAPAMFNCQEVPLARLVEERIGVLPILVEDGWAAVIAEHRFGSVRDRDGFLCVLCGREIGLGAMLKGKVFKAVPGVTGDFGHTCVVRDGRPCPCGKRGCLTRYIATGALLEQGRERFGGRLPPDKPNVRDVFALAAQGDAAAMELVDEGIDRLAFALAGVLEAVPVETVVLTGGLSEFGNQLIQPLQARLLAYTQPVRTVEVRLTQLGIDSVMIGVAFFNGEDFY